jgi:carbonic anhydrase
MRPGGNVETFDRRGIVKQGIAGSAALLLGLRSWKARAGDATPGATDEQPHWTYEGEEGPEHWGELDADYASCSTGEEQSPIDISEADGADLTDIAFSYQTVSPIRLVNNGHTLQVNIPEGSSIAFDGATYPLKQFHFHTPSEHTIDGRAEPMELHLVHITDGGEIAVVGVMLAEGEENVALQPVFAAMPATAGPEVEVDGSIDLAALLPTVQTTYRYSGSLTTPPCTEGVHWLVMTEPMTVSTTQIETFRAVFEMNARPVQPLDERTVNEDTTP